MNAKGVPTERLSAKSQFVLVLRLVIEIGGKVTGELVDPVSQRRQRFIGLAGLADELKAWIDDALRSAVGDSRSPPDEEPGETR